MVEGNWSLSRLYILSFFSYESHTYISNLQKYFQGIKIKQMGCASSTHVFTHFEKTDTCNFRQLQLLMFLINKSFDNYNNFVLCSVCLHFVPSFRFWSSACQIVVVIKKYVQRCPKYERASSVCKWQYGYTYIHTYLYAYVHWELRVLILKKCIFFNCLNISLKYF